MGKVSRAAYAQVRGGGMLRAVLWHDGRGRTRLGLSQPGPIDGCTRSVMHLRKQY